MRLTFNGIVTAILDRLLHRAEIIQMDEESYRMRYRSTIFTEHKE
ncbi:ATP-binding protein [Exiguobacterium sp. s143]